MSGAKPKTDDEQDSRSLHENIFREPKRRRLHQLCRLLRPRDSCAKCGCCASPGGVTHLQEKKGSPRWAKIPASRKYEKTRARSSYRKRTSRYASRARATARCARRALIPPSKARSTFAATPPEAQQGDARRKNALASRKKPSTEEHMMRRKTTTYL